MKTIIKGDRLELVAEAAGERVVLTNVTFECTHCHRILEPQDFNLNLRRMRRDGHEWRSQPRCMDCR